VQAYPESLLAKLADNEDDGVMEEKGDTIRLDRDPTLFAHVLQRFDKPLEAVETEALREELDFYGMLPCSTMPPAAAFAVPYSRLLESVVSSIVSQMAVLMNEKLPVPSDEEGIIKLGRKLSFYLSKPTDRWSEVQVRQDDTWTAADKDVDTLSPLIQQPLETRLRSLGYTVSIGRAGVRFKIKFVHTIRITVSWPDK
jgi:hypothetical protein